MAIRPEKLAEILSIPLEAAQVILDRRSDLSEQELRSRLHKVGPIENEQRSWTRPPPEEPAGHHQVLVEV